MFVANNNRFLINDGTGNFVSFDGIQMLDKRQCVELLFDDDSSIVVTSNHMVRNRLGSFITAADVSIGEVLDNEHIIVSKRVLDGTNRVFDIVNSNTHTYKTNDIISHNCSFVGSSNTLIEASVLNTIPIKNPIQSYNGLNYFQMPKKEAVYAITVDVSRGRGLDYTAFSVFDINATPYNVVCSFKNNTINPNIELPALLNKIGRMYNQALILVENNDLGESVGNALWFDYEYDNLIWTHNDQIAGHGIVGIKTTRKVKSVGTTALKTLIENHQLRLNDFRYVEELGVFVRQKKGLYGAQDASINDDLTATAWLFGWLTQQTYFQDLTNNNINQTIGKKFQKDIDDYIPEGFFSDGINDTEMSQYSLSEDQIDLLGGRDNSYEDDSWI